MISRRMERCVLQNGRISVNVSLLRTMHEERVRLTGDRDRHVKKRGITRYKIQDLGKIPPGSPDMFDFAIEEDEPVVNLQRSERKTNDGYD